MQSEEKNLDKQDSVRGTVKAAVLKNDPVAPNIVAASVYDTKPVHIISSVVDKIEWLTKERQIYDKDSKEYKEIEYLRLNLIEWYNAGMGGVDIADQLRNEYRPDHWMRKRKWWWAIYMWAMGVVHTNAYLLYKKVQLRASNKKTMLSHHAFLQRLAFQLIWPERYIPGYEKPTSGTRTVYTGKGARAKQRKLDSKSKPKSVAVLTEKTLLIGFPNRLDGFAHGFELCVAKYCQYCHLKAVRENNELGKKSKKRGEKRKMPARNTENVQRCKVCNVRLCVECWHEWHGIV